MVTPPHRPESGAALEGLALSHEAATLLGAFLKE